MVVNVPRELGPFARKSTRTLHYSTIVDVSVVAGLGEFQFTTNGLYDPDISGFGHQPMGFDQLMALFHHYVVHKSTISVVPVTTFTADDCAVLVVNVAPDTTFVSGGTISTACERQGSRWRVVQSGENMRTPVRSSWTRKAYFGSANETYNIGNAAANPVEQSYYQISWFDPNLATYTCKMLVNIFYDADFYEPKAFASS
jgi:hypothetical protein